MILTSNYCWHKTESGISIEILYAQIKNRFRWKQSKTVLNKYSDIFISCLDSHSDGTPFTAEDLMVNKWYNANFLT